jgi:hypothetical protein
MGKNAEISEKILKIHGKFRKIQITTENSNKPQKFQKNT